MDRTKLVNLFCDLNSEIPAEYHGDLEELLKNKFEKSLQELSCTLEDIYKVTKPITDLYFSNESSPEWQYICLNFYSLHLLNEVLSSSNEEVLSVQQRKNIRLAIKRFIGIGIQKNLQPNLPHCIKFNTTKHEDVLQSYNIIKCTVYGLCKYQKLPEIRLLILPDSLQDILIALYQISFCPLKKPTSNFHLKEDQFQMSEEMYDKLMKEKEVFKNILDDLKNTIHPAIFIKETMVIFKENAPTWFKKAVSKTLTTIIRGRNGVENIAVALLDGTENDSTKTWKILEVITKLILSCKIFPDFKENTCKQTIDLLDKVKNETQLIFERIFVCCTKTLYHQDTELGTIFLRKIITPLVYFTYKEHLFNDGEDVTVKLKQNVRLLHSLFIEDALEYPRIPLDLLKSVTNVLFRFYAITVDSSFTSTNNELKEIIINILTHKPIEIFKLFDSFLFGLDLTDVLPFRSDIILKMHSDNIVLNIVDHTVKYSTNENAEVIMTLLKNRTELLSIFFGYLMNCLCERKRYFTKANEELMDLETEFMNEYIERSLTVYKLLSDLAEDKSIQKYITEKPEDIIKYINNVFVKTLETGTHKTNEVESDGFQSVFTVVMILQALVSHSSRNNLEKFQILLGPLNQILKESGNVEINGLIRNIVEILENSDVRRDKTVEDEEKTELDKVIEDICDPLLPVRGHGLLELAKLVEKKDQQAMKRKQYILNIFQQNLKNDDSFIYLSAIGGLAAMADIFPDTVINILCEEYTDFSKKDDEGHEVRMKLGEVLVRTTKILGEMAPKYKSLLLNTFLVGARDDDFLIRASSLSNLGEVCRVLGYKLGTIVSEVLVCVHAIITTDKSIEARRAAVTVIRQLFIGLESEMIAFLKDEILPIYRTLKQIYNNDKDDVMKLQAQLALEELNANMKNFVFPKPELNMEKKIIMLN